MNLDCNLATSESSLLSFFSLLREKWFKYNSEIHIKVEKVALAKFPGVALSTRSKSLIGQRKIVM